MKLYLVRKNLSTYIGPYSIDKIRKYAASVHCAQQDEISKSCGKWVKISDSSRLGKYYPELVTVFSSSDEFFDRSIVTEKPSKTPKKQKKSLVLNLVLALAAFGTFGSLATKFVPIALNNMKSSEIAKYMQEFNVKSRSSFISNFSKKVPSIVDLQTTNSDLFSKWLPLLRAYAFSVDGQIPGVSNQILYGPELPLKQYDCSLKRWDREWTQATQLLPRWLNGTWFSDADWARILSWDMIWVNRREKSGWISPSNAYLGCIEMAHRSIKKLKVNIPHRDVIERRLSNMIRLAGGQKVILEEVTPEIPDYSTCLESAKNQQELSQCFLSRDIVDDSMNRYLEYRYFMRRASIFIETQSSVDPKTVLAIQNMSDSAPLTQLNYRKEIEFLRKNLQNQSGLAPVQSKTTSTSNDPTSP